MYHIAYIAPNQEESEFCKNLQRVLESSGKEPVFSKANTPTEIRRIMKTRHDYLLFCVSTAFTPKQLFERICVLAEDCKRKHRIVPLIYDVDWSNPLPSVLGTRWGGHVSILHNLSTRNEILATLQRLGELLEGVDQSQYRLLGTQKRASRF